MARVNISLPDELYARAKDEGLNISRLARKAIVDELQRRAKIAAAYDYLAELETELGPISSADQARADAWVDGIVARAEGSEAGA